MIENAGQHFDRLLKLINTKVEKYDVVFEKGKKEFYMANAQIGELKIEINMGSLMCSIEMNGDKNDRTFRKNCRKAVKVRKKVNKLFNDLLDNRYRGEIC